MGFESVLKWQKIAEQCTGSCMYILGGYETQFIMFCRLVSELLIKGTIEDIKGDLLEHVK